MATGAATLATCSWLMLGLPLGVDAWLTENGTPAPARAIIYLTGGVSGDNLPIDEGWHRIHTAAELFADGRAPSVIFSGGGSSTISEAEVYAQAAVWLGVPQQAVLVDPVPRNTAEHPPALLTFEPIHISPATPLLIVTSALYSKRAAMCFRKAGFTNFQMIVSYEAAERDGRVSAQPVDERLRLIPSEAGHVPGDEPAFAVRATGVLGEGTDRYRLVLVERRRVTAVRLPRPSKARDFTRA